jgi:hypothetical protein
VAIFTNAPSHTSVLTQQFLVKNKMAVISHPLYSPDLAPCDFFLFPKMKLKLRGRLFDTINLFALGFKWLPTTFAYDILFGRHLNFSTRFTKNINIPGTKQD